MNEVSKKDAISFFCDKCQNRIQVPAKLAGQKGKCPTCETALTVPDQSEVEQKTAEPETDEANSEEDLETPDNGDEQATLRRPAQKQTWEFGRRRSTPIRDLFGQKLFRLMVTVLVVGLAYLAFITWAGRGGPKKGVYFMDTTTGELVPVYGALAEKTPQKFQNGNEGVRAIVYSCGQCKGDEDMRIAYLEKWTPEALSARESGDRELLDTLFQHDKVIRIGHPKSKKWFNLASPESEWLLGVVRNTKCRDIKFANECFPAPK